MKSCISKIIAYRKDSAFLRNSKNNIAGRQHMAVVRVSDGVGDAAAASGKSKTAAYRVTAIARQALNRQPS